MNLFEALEWSTWKNLSTEVKVQVISQVLMYFVSPLKKVSDVVYCEFELSGVKCGTFECTIDKERFVLVPGSKEVILGWDLGTQGLSSIAWDVKEKKGSDYYKKMAQSYFLESNEDWNDFVNESTSALRKVSVPPMLVQKEAWPVGTDLIGELNIVTGEFTGSVEQFASVEPLLRKYFKQPKSLEESFLWEQPKEIFEKDHFYAVLQAEEELYRIFSHQTCTLASLRKKVNEEIFDLMDENQWEYAVGGGTRKLFRWGNEIPQSNHYYGKQALHKMNQENMFGLFFDTSRKRWEITDSDCLKLEKLTATGIPLFDALPLSSYYRSRKILSEEERLDPCDFLYRKAIIIRSE